MHEHADPSTPDPRASIPNLLTIARLAMTAVVIALLSVYHHPDERPWALPIAGGVFILAALTDTLDGFLARRWNVVSLFGRIMDPFADKALVLGSFIVLAGPGFAGADGGSVAGVAPWMVVLLLARELLVTSIRAVMEGSGVSFSAKRAGKLKMVLQSVAIPLILALLWLGPRDELRDPAPIVRGVIAGVVWLTVLVTVVSGVPYLVASARAVSPAGANTP